MGEVNDGKRVELRVEALLYEDGPLRFRQLLAESETKGGERIEVSLCMSATALYFMTKRRQIAVPIRNILEALGGHFDA